MTHLFGPGFDTTIHLPNKWCLYNSQFVCFVECKVKSDFKTIFKCPTRYSLAKTWYMFEAQGFRDYSRMGRSEQWVTILLPASNSVLVWLCCPSSDEWQCCWGAQGNPPDGTNYSIPDIARDHHLHGYHNDLSGANGRSWNAMIQGP